MTNEQEIAELFKEAYLCAFVKISFIKKLPNGKWRVVSHKGKNLGTYNTKEEAQKRLRQVEFFKHKKNASTEISYSAIMRELNKNHPDLVEKFQKSYKSAFDNAILNKEHNPQDMALESALQNIGLETFNKQASAIEMGTPETAGKYLSNVIRFLLKRISSEKRNKSLENLRNKIYYINEYDIANKKVPPSSAIGQSITLLKTVLLEHTPQYIRSVLNNIVSNL